MPLSSWRDHDEETTLEHPDRADALPDTAANGALATNEPLDGTNGINITSSNMEDATVTGSATANAAEADITDEVDLTKDPGKDFSGYEAMLTTASDSVTYYETFSEASEAAQKSADSTIKLLKDVKASGNDLNFFKGTVYR